MEDHSLHLLSLILVASQFISALPRELAISGAAPLSKSFQCTEALPDKSTIPFKSFGSLQYLKK